MSSPIARKTPSAKVSLFPAKMRTTNVATVAIRTLLPEIIWALGNMTQPSNKVKMSIQQIDYKPFISLFNVTNATLYDPDISGIGQYQ
jgi:hypothetical protein